MVPRNKYIPGIYKQRVCVIRAKHRPGRQMTCVVLVCFLFVVLLLPEQFLLRMGACDISCFRIIPKVRFGMRCVFSLPRLVARGRRGVVSLYVGPGGINQNNDTDSSCDIVCAVNSYCLGAARAPLNREIPKFLENIEKKNKKNSPR